MPNWKSGVAGLDIVIYESSYANPTFVAQREVSSGVYLLVKVFLWWKVRVKL